MRHFPGRPFQLLTTFISKFILILAFTAGAASVRAQFMNFKTRNVAFQAGLEYVQAMWFSPDNKFAYTASAGGLGMFDFNSSTGSLRLKELQNMQAYGYSNSSINNIVFSSDGQFGYATVPYTKNIYSFKRDAITGRMTFVGQVQDYADQFGYMSALIISPDDKFLYVGNGSTLNIYKRNLVDGSVALVDREWSGVGGSDFHISQDGKFMYISCVAYTRDAGTGMISLLENHLEWNSLVGNAGYMAVTPDEKFVMVGTQSNGIARFSRDAATGKMTYLGIFNYPRPGDVNYPVGPLQVNDMRINPAGDRLYVSSYQNLTSYSIDPSGTLALLDKIDVHSSPNNPYFGLALSRNAEYIFGFGSGFRETSVECFNENSDSKLVSIRINYFGESLNKGLYNVAAEALSTDNQFIFTASQDKCMTAFNSGISNGGFMSEINRINYQDFGLTDDYNISSILTTPDGKRLYVTASNYATNVSILFIFDVAATGVISYHNKFEFNTTISDVQVTSDSHYMYVACDDRSLRIFNCDLSGDLTATSTLTPTEMGYYWGPEQIIITSDNKKVMVKSMMAQDSYVTYNAFNLIPETGALQSITDYNIITSGHYKNTFKMMLSESRKMIYFVTVYPDVSIYTYPWDPNTGEMGQQAQRLIGAGDFSRWASLSADENLLLVNSDTETMYYGFYADGTAGYLGSELKTSVVAWSNGGSESGSERFLFLDNNKIVYAIRPSGNGVYMYELQSVLPPLPPANVKATNGDNKITVTWDPNKETGVTYQLYRQASYLGATPGSSATKVAETTNTNFVDITVPVNSAVYYWVKAVASSGKTSAYSLNSNLASAYDLAPAAPSNVTLQAGDRFLKLTWSPNSETDFHHYAVYRNTTNNLAGASMVLTTTITTGTDVTVGYGQTYFYWVKAIDNNSNSSDPSTVVSGTPLDLPPAKPIGLAITAGDKFLKLAWSANTEPDFNHYSIYRNTSNDLATASMLLTTTATTNTDEAVEYGQAYYYWLKATDNNSNSSDITSVSGTAIDSPPAMPNDLAITAGDKFLKLTWSPNTETDFLLYKIYKSTTPDTQNAILLQTAAENSLTDNDVQYLQSYYYFLRAVDQRGNESSFTPAVTGIPTDNPPAKPEGVTAEYHNSEGIVITWSPNTEVDLKGYTLYRGTANATAAAEQIAVLSKGDISYLYQTELPGEVFFWVAAFDNDNNVSPFSESAGVLITGVEPPKKSVAVYPNPARDFLQVSTDYPEGTYALFNTLGFQAKRGNIGENKSIDLRDLSPGVYLCRIESNDGVHVFTIFKI